MFFSLSYIPLLYHIQIACGFLTDSFPIMGLRRKPYFLLGWGLYIICNIVLAIVKEPDLHILATFIFAMTLSFVQVIWHVFDR